jgi:ribonuclease BN (tRNA processing enzyme)
VKAHEIKPGVIYKDANVTVTAFATKHAMESYEYRFETPDRTIVISGDTNPVEETIKACNGCDVLIHEAQSLELLAKMPESIQAFVAKYYTTTEQLAELSTKAKPKLLVVYHTISFPPGIAPPRLLPPKAGADALYVSPEMLQKEISSRYSGKLAIGRTSTCIRSYWSVLNSQRSEPTASEGGPYNTALRVRRRRKRNILRSSRAR